jgi:hypothetical protein
MIPLYGSVKNVSSPGAFGLPPMGSATNTAAIYFPKYETAFIAAEKVRRPIIT